MKKIITSTILIISLSSAVAAPKANLSEVNDAPKAFAGKVLEAGIGYIGGKIMDHVINKGIQAGKGKKTSANPVKKWKHHNHQQM